MLTEEGRCPNDVQLVVLALSSFCSKVYQVTCSSLRCAPWTFACISEPVLIWNPGWCSEKQMMSVDEQRATHT